MYYVLYSITGPRELVFLFPASGGSRISSKTSRSSAPSSLTIPSFSDTRWIDEHTLAAAKPGSGMVVAVKKLKPEGFQGHKEWLTEVDYLGQLHHPNLVKLIGYCSEGENRLLVYEFMPKGSLENHLFRRRYWPAIQLADKAAKSCQRHLPFPTIFSCLKGKHLIKEYNNEVNNIKAVLSMHVLMRSEAVYLTFYMFMHQKL
ncbi:hypothetical protein REPUB_Repub15cG0062300 [Reevesia pubescens]